MKDNIFNPYGPHFVIKMETAFPPKPTAFTIIVLMPSGVFSSINGTGINV